MGNRTSSHLPDFDKAASRQRIRSHFGSVAEAQRQLDVNPRTFDSALNGSRGHTRKNSLAAQVIHRLDDMGLLVKK